jgi:transposase
MGIYTKGDKKEIKRLLRKTKDTVMYRKYQVILFHMKGYNNTQIAELIELERKTVGRYIQNFKIGGIPNLVPKKSPGRPCFLDKSQEQEVFITISNNTPDEVGFDGIKNWTAKIACEWVLRKFGVRYSVNGMLDMFHRLNLSYTRPTYVLAKADPGKQAQFINDFEGIKKNSLMVILTTFYLKTNLR